MLCVRVFFFLLFLFSSFLFFVGCCLNSLFFFAFSFFFKNFLRFCNFRVYFVTKLTPFSIIRLFPPFYWYARATSPSVCVYVMMMAFDIELYTTPLFLYLHILLLSRSSSVKLQAKVDSYKFSAESCIRKGYR